jgi:hypothetical protein
VAARAQELARAPVHLLAAPVQERAPGPVPARAAQVPGQVPGLAQEQALQALRQAPVLEQVREQELEAELAVAAALERRALARLVQQREPPAAPPHLMQAMAAPAVARRQQEARQTAGASPAFGDVFLAEDQTMPPRRLLLPQEGLLPMRCMC